MNACRIGILALVALATAAGEGGAQMKPMGIELRAGATIPRGDLKQGLGLINGVPAAPAKTDMAWGADLYWTFHRYAGAYLGYSLVEFDCDDDSCGTDGNYSSRGFEFGFKFSMDRDRDFAPWVRVGGFGHKFKFTEGDVEEVSNRPIGLEVAVGTDLALGALALVPAVRYHHMKPSLDLATASGRGKKNVTWFQTDLGLMWRRR